MGSETPYVQQPNASALCEVAGSALGIAALGIGLAGLAMCAALICYVGLVLQIPVAVEHCSGFFAEMHAIEYGIVVPILGPLLSPPAVWLANLAAIVIAFLLASRIYAGGEALKIRARAIAEKAGFVYPPGYHD